MSEVAQSCLTLCDPMDCSLPGSSVHGIFQARILEWVAISFSRGSSWPRDRTQVSRIVGRRFTIWATREAQVKSLSRVWLFETPRTAVHQALHPWDFPGKGTGVGYHSPKPPVDWGMCGGPALLVPRGSRARIPDLPLSSFIAFSKIWTLFVLMSLHLKIGDNNTG